MSTAARVLWTKQVRKKSKTYNDGFLLISASGTATLYDENGKELSSATSKLPYGLAADPASAEDLACFEGYLVQGDSACDPAEISAARDQSPNDSNTSTSTKQPRTYPSAPTGVQVQPRFPAGTRGSAGAGARPGVALGPPKAALLPKRFNRNATSGTAAASVAQRQASLRPTPAAGNNSSRSLGAGAAGVQGNVHGHHLVAPFSNNSSGFQGLYSNAGQCGDAAVLGGGDAGGVANPQSDMDILQLLDSIAPEDCSTHSSINHTAGGHPPAAAAWGQWGQQQQQQQQQPQQTVLPAVPQFGRKQPLQQQQQPGNAQQGCQSNQGSYTQLQQQQHQQHASHDSQGPLQANSLQATRQQPYPQQPAQKQQVMTPWQQRQQQQQQSQPPQQTLGQQQWQQPRHQQPGHQQLWQKWQQQQQQQEGEEDAEKMQPADEPQPPQQTLGEQQWQQPRQQQAWQQQQQQPQPPQQSRDNQQWQQPGQQQPRQQQPWQQWQQQQQQQQQQEEDAENMEPQPPQQTLHEQQWQQPKQQQARQQQPWQHWQQQQQQEDDDAENKEPADELPFPPRDVDLGMAPAFMTARGTLQAPQQQHGSTQLAVSQLPQQQQQQQAAACATWGQPPAPQQQQQQQPQRQQARMLWQGPTHPEVGSNAGTCAPAASGATAAAAAAAAPRQNQQRAGFNMPRPLQHTPSSSAAAGVPPKSLNHQGRQQQQQQCSSSVQGYYYPGPTAGPPQRVAQVPTAFSSAQQYVGVLTAALIEEANLQMAEQARMFYGIIRQQQQQQQQSLQLQQQQRQQGQYQQHQQDQQGSKPQGGSDLASRLQAACGRAGLHYYPGASLTVYNNSGSNNRGGYSRGGGGWGKGKKRGRRGGGEDDEGDEEGAGAEGTPSKARSMYLTIPGKLDRRQFRKHDLWVLSNQPLLQASAADSSSNGAHYDRLKQPWTVLAKALWHGPDRDGKMEVELLPGQQLLLPPHHTWQRQQALTALQGPDVATEVQVADFISKADTRAWSLMSHLLKPVQQQQQLVPASLGAAGTATAAAGAADRAASVEPSGFSTSAGPSSGPSSNSSPSLKLQDPEIDGSRSRQEVAPVQRRKQRRRREIVSVFGSDDDLDFLPSSTRTAAAASAGGLLKDSDEDLDPQLDSTAAATAAAAGESLEDSDWEDEFELEPAAGRAAKRARKDPAAAAGAAAGRGSGVHRADTEAAADSDTGDSDTDDLEPGLERKPAAATTAAAAAPAVGDTAVAAQQLLAHIVRQFRLNPAQAAVAAHIADWLPQLMQDVQQRQQQAEGRGTVRPKIYALTAKKAAAAAPDHAVGKGSASSSGGNAGSSSSRPPVCLIHGQFGSGKSTLLVALIHLLTGLPAQQSTGSSSRQDKASTPTPRILVAAHTNVAVDRVLLGLMDAGFSNMLRVGSLQRIAKRLLGVSLHSADDSRDALAQLNGMLKGAAGAEEAMIRSEITAIQAGAERRRRRALSTTAVVGITCCSALQSTLEGQVFDVVLLDEASQMTEPTSLVPLLRAMPRFAIAAGDPCQLPPVLATPTAVTVMPGRPTAAAGAAVDGDSSSNSHMPGPLGTVSAAQSQQSGSYGLLRPLFVRLTHLGHVPHLLTHQYRCHPMLSHLSNKHFYNSRLVDGVTAAQRGALVPGLAPLVFCDCQGASQAAGGGSRSSINKPEAHLVAQLVLRLLKATGSGTAPGLASETPAAAVGGDAAAVGQAGAAEGAGQAAEGEAEDGCSEAAPVLAAHQLGVICFFRGQANLIRQMLAADPSCPSAADVQVATVDSFQGAEKEVIILATTTTNPHSEFCSDGARLNVALTRARRHLVVVGSAAVLSQTASGVLRELVGITRSGQQRDAAYMPSSNLLQLLS